MKEPPKIVRERLGRHELRPETGAPSTHSAEHLDPNLIGAFVEHNLVSSERSRVLDHLAECEQCRAEVKLVEHVAAAANVIAAVAPAPRSSARLGWRGMLSWQGSAAGAAALLAIAALWVSIRPVPQPIREVRGSIVRNGSPLPAEFPKQNPPRLETAAKPPTSHPMQLRVEAAVKREALSKALKVTTGNGFTQTSSQKPATLSSKLEPDMAYTNRTSPPAAPALAAPAPPFSSATAVSQPPSATSTAVNSSVPAPNTNTILIPNSSPLPSGERAFMKATPARAQALIRPSAARTFDSPLRWATSDSATPGVVEKSTDGGQTWQSVVVATGVRIRAVFALDRDVWAGGDRGALFRSTNDGVQWLVVPVSNANTTPSGDIVLIEFSDQAHGSVTTASGEVWATADAGAHWQKLK